MFQKHSFALALWIVLGLMAISSPASANTITAANVIDNCNGYQIQLAADN